MSKKSGFTLVELLVSIALFALFVITAISMLISFLRLNSANQTERQSLRGVVFLVENVLREVRLGTNYRCSVEINEGVLSETTDDCSKAKIIKFKRGDGTGDTWITYRISGSLENGKIERCQKQIRDTDDDMGCDRSEYATLSDKAFEIDFNSTFFNVNTGAVSLEDEGEWISDGTQPSVEFHLKGRYPIGNNNSKHISLSTKATQRPLGFGEIESEGFRGEIEKHLIAIKVGTVINCYDRNGDNNGEAAKCTNIGTNGYDFTNQTALRINLDEIFNIGGNTIYGIGSNNRIYSINSNTGASSVVGFPARPSLADIEHHFNQNRDVNNISSFFIGGDSVFAIRSDNRVYEINNGSGSRFVKPTPSIAPAAKFLYNKYSNTVVHTLNNKTYQLSDETNNWITLSGVNEQEFKGVAIADTYIVFLNEEGNLILRNNNSSEIESIVKLEEGADDILYLKAEGKQIESLVLFGDIVKKVIFTASFPDNNSIPSSQAINEIESSVDSDFNVEIGNLLGKDDRYIYYRDLNDESTQYRVFNFEVGRSGCFKIVASNVNNRITEQEGASITSVEEVSVLNSGKHTVLINSGEERRLVVSDTSVVTSEGDILLNGCNGIFKQVHVDILGPTESNFNAVIVE